MKKFLIITLFAAAVCLLCGCSGCNINDRARTVYCVPQISGENSLYNLKPYTFDNSVLQYNKTTGEAYLTEGGTQDYYEETFPTVLWGDDSPRNEFRYAEEYEKLSELLTQKYEKGKVTVIQSYAVEFEGVAYGFCNLYSGTGGFLFSGGCIDAGKIIGGVYFTYDKSDGSFTEICNLEKCNIVAFNTQKLIYFKGEKYYSYDADSGKEKFICNDEAYDKGSTNYSAANFLFDEDVCIIIMRVGYSDYTKDYTEIVLTDYDGNVILATRC